MDTGKSVDDASCATQSSLALASLELESLPVKLLRPVWTRSSARRARSESKPPESRGFRSGDSGDSDGDDGGCGGGSDDVDGMVVIMLMMMVTPRGSSKAEIKV
jgi:hypothetical protein